MAHSYKNIVITPNIGVNNDPSIQFSGANSTVNTDITLRVYPDSNGTLSFEGSAGQLFSITNDLSGSVFAVNDVSGIPLVEVNVASQQITLGEFYGNVGIGKSSSTSSIYKLDVNGTINASNVLINGNAITGGATSLTPANNWANTVGTAGNNYTNTVGVAGNNYTNAVGTAGNNYTNSTVATVNNFFSITAANNAIGANNWANTVGAAANNYASILAANNAIGANGWANTLSTTDKAIANNYANAVGAASNAYAATLGVNTSLAYTWTNTHTYQNTVTFSSNVFFRNTSNIVWITNAASTTGNVTLRNYPDSNGTLSFEGSAGQLFSITNDLTGSLFAVNDVSGIPLVEVNVTSQQITFGEFYGNVGIGKSSSTSSIYKLDVNGTINASNILINTVPVLVSLTPANNWANTVGTAGNNYTNTVGASSNAYTNAVGAAGNNYASILASNNAIGANGWANTVGTAGNNYTNTVGTAGNNYASILAANNAVGANAWANSINTFSTSTYVRLTAPSQTITGSLSITGNLTLLGNATSIVSNNLIIGDSLIYLAANNYSGTDIVDIGFVANYANGTGANVHTGLIRDATTKQYYLFQGLDIELQANNQTFTPGANGVVNATLNADLVTNSITLNSQNIYSIINSSGAASNTWANTVGTAGNNYTNSVGTAGNNYASVLAANIAVGTNAYTVTVGAASNNWANSINAKVYVSNTGPTSNVNGSLWWNSELGRLFVYYSDGDSNQWVQASPVTTSQSALSNTSNTFFAGNFFIPDGFTLGIGTTETIAPLTISKSAVASVTLAGALIDADGTTNSYLQSAIRNANTGTNASTDWVATTDDGTDTTNFIDLGINGSGFTSAGWTINGARDGYLYTIDSNLSIGSANSTSRTKYINFFVGGSLSSNEAMRIQDSSTGPNIGIGTTAPASKLDVNGLIRDSKGDVRDIPLNNQGTSYTLVLSDTGKVVSSTANVTVPNAVFSSGQAVTVYNNSASSITITQGGSVTVYLAGSATTGNRTLAQRGLATILNVAANTFVISGAGLT